MRAGLLRHKITVQQVTETLDTFGDPVKSWTTYAIRRASKKTKSGTENYLVSQIVTEYSDEFRIRHDSITAAITEKMRVSFNSRNYDINGIINANERNTDIILLCTETKHGV